MRDDDACRIELPGARLPATPRAGPGAARAPSIRVLLVDDHPLLRAGIRLALQPARGVSVVGEAGSVEEAIGLLPSCEPGVVVTDIRMPGRSGIELVGELAGRGADVRVLLLSMLDDAVLIGRALAAGAAGYVRKDAPADALLTAIHTVALGDRYVDPTLDAQLALAQPGRRAPTPLTSRESAVLQLIAQGLGSREIAEALAMSVRTVETHRLRVRRKLRLQGDVSLASYVQTYPEIVRTPRSDGPKGLPAYSPRLP